MIEEEQNPITVHIFNKEYKVAVDRADREPLLNSARYLDRKMKEIRDKRRVVGADRIAVMAALNIAYDLLQIQSGSPSEAHQIESIKEKVESALHRLGQDL
ncbi:MAG: cell division protein ZapA [Gammaproteobacteria bacterium]|nr:cell division protein ZapA [Gammaproteobacteria bacterium]MDH5803289.1 cell division protein ZapA [Gammaproteobacteria bacterium]